ncbi:MAG: hypothetical protein WKF30_05625 [Pyrinomonadaceae bacterium]
MLDSGPINFHTIMAFVVMRYFGYLRRDPDVLYTRWIGVLNNTGDLRVMVDGFINSVEYRTRFGRPSAAEASIPRVKLVAESA